MADLDDGPDQFPLEDSAVGDTVLDLLGGEQFDLVLTHGPRGEYTRHLRHEEVSRAVGRLYEAGAGDWGRVWMFNYEDGERAYLPRARPNADVRLELSEGIWRRKYELITDVYGFSDESFEAKTTPREEAFSVFGRQGDL